MTFYLLVVRGDDDCDSYSLWKTEESAYREAKFLYNNHDIYWHDMDIVEVDAYD